MIQRLWLLISISACLVVAPATEGQQSKSNHGRRPSWTASRIVGTPEPPPPYRSQRVFPRLSFNQPVLITHVPGSDRLLVAEQAGAIYTFRQKQPDRRDLLIDLTKAIKSYDPQRVRGVGAVYGLAFHPRFEENRYCYICYILRSAKKGENLPNGTRVSRFVVQRSDPPVIDPGTEKIVLTWREGGHNGGCLKFGKDGYLYISTGDATPPNPPDALDTGQDCSDLLSSILRIDVDREEPDRPYAIPPDNPFVGRTGIRPEIWAYGFRNPWRMSIDRKTGDLWVGDVGWETWELVYRVEKGGNYGWSIVEGEQPVKPNGKRGPTPIRSPTIAFPHTDAASITGGYVYRGKRYPELYGTYICGDWETKTIWGAKWDGNRISSLRVLAQTTQRIVAFGEDHDGEIYFLDYDPRGGIYQLVPNDDDLETSRRFPRRLSETGLFTDVKRHVPALGVFDFEINAEQWVDGATSRRWIALPGTDPVRMYAKPQPIERSMFRSRYRFPPGSVLVKTLFLPGTERPAETQLLHFDGRGWHAYSFAWNDDATDAVLVEASGDEREYRIADGRGKPRSLRWTFLGRKQCLQCHNPWSEFNLAFVPQQLDRADASGANQLEHLRQAGIVAIDPSLRSTSAESGRWVDPYSPKASIEDRARTYLQVNCAHCHQFGAGGSATIDLRRDRTIEQMQVVDWEPVQGTFGIASARIVAPGDPDRSILYFRMATTGQGRMPHIGSRIVDVRGLLLIRRWIEAMPSPGLVTQDFWHPFNGQVQDHLLRRAAESLPDALCLASLLDRGCLSPSCRQRALKYVAESRNRNIREIFERFLPEELRRKTLGDRIEPQRLLALRGDPGRGRLVFRRADCIKCHRQGSEGTDIGPSLNGLAGRMQRSEILEHILDPSKKVDDQYRPMTLLLKNGRVVVGLVEKTTADQVILRDNRAQRLRIRKDDIEQMTRSRSSLMPTGLLRNLTAQEAADLLAYLASLR